MIVKFTKAVFLFVFSQKENNVIFRLFIGYPLRFRIIPQQRSLYSPQHPELF